MRLRRLREELTAMASSLTVRGVSAGDLRGL